MAYMRIGNMKGPRGWGYSNLRTNPSGHLLVDVLEGETVIETGRDVGALPVGPPANMTAGLTVLAPGSQPTVTMTGTAPNYNITFGLPMSALWSASATLLPPGSQPTAAVTGTYPNLTIMLGIPKGDKGDTGVTPAIVPTVTTLPPGSDATVTISGSAENPTIAFGIPKGEPGNASASIIDTTIATTTSWSSDLSSKEARLSGSNLVPNGALEYGDAKWWPSAVVYDTADKPAGLRASIRCAAGAGTQTSTGTMWFAVDPNVPYELEFWLKADKPNSVIFIELQNQDSVAALPATSGTVGNGYIANNLPVPTAWTKYTATVSFTATTRIARVGAIYFNHTNGTERGAVQSIAGLRIRRSVAAASHTHNASDITAGTFAAARLPAGTSGAAGALQLATDVEAKAATSTAKALTPANLLAAYTDWQFGGYRKTAVFIGSSNAVAGTWPDQLCTAMGWTMKNFAVTGGSFHGDSFYNQLVSAAADSSFVNADVGWVFIADCSNDVRAMVATAPTTVPKALSYARTTFPNARIIVLPVIWPSDPVNDNAGVPGGWQEAWVKWLRADIEQIRVTARANRIEVIEHTETWLLGHPEWMSSGGDVHANAAGYTEIARQVMRYLRGEETPSVGVMTNPTPTSSFYVTSNLWVSRTNDDVILQGKGVAQNSTAAGSDWAFLPEGMRPMFLTSINALEWGSWDHHPFSIWPNGVIRQQWAGSGLQEIYFNATWKAC